MTEDASRPSVSLYSCLALQLDHLRCTAREDGLSLRA